jgi:leucyl-tRNA synthetase
MGPLEAVKPWSTKGVEGVYRFLGRVWRLVMEEDQTGKWILNRQITSNAPSAPLTRRLHETIKKVTEDIENLQFNTAIAQLMILVNDLTKEKEHPQTVLETLVLILSPFAPHMAEELWSQLGHQRTLAYEKWPSFDLNYLVTDQVDVVIQINGKVRGRLSISAKADQQEVEAASKKVDGVQERLQGATIQRTIFVPQKLINFVVS